MIAPKELDRIREAQLKSWEENKGLLGVKKETSPLRLNWLTKMRVKISKINIEKENKRKSNANN